jgi:hypothetical protein
MTVARQLAENGGRRVKSCACSPMTPRLGSFSPGCNSFRWAASDCWTRSWPQPTGRQASNRSSRPTKSTSWCSASSPASPRSKSYEALRVMRVCMVSSSEKVQGRTRDRSQAYGMNNRYHSDAVSQPSMAPAASRAAAASAVRVRMAFSPRVRCLPFAVRHLGLGPVQTANGHLHPVQCTSSKSPGFHDPSKAGASGP